MREYLPYARMHIPWSMEVRSYGLPDELGSERLRLISMTPAFIQAVLDGKRAGAGGLLDVIVPDEWPDEDVRYLHLWLKDMIDAPQFAKWRARVIVHAGSEPHMIGHAGFHGPPDESGMVEMGYTIFPKFRRRGLASEAAQRLIDFAKENGAARIRASVSPDNAPSLAMMKKLGLVQIGEQMDEIDGLELVFERGL
jgi:ribosomal-protein-alanine N-acetyltransferase